MLFCQGSNQLPPGIEVSDDISTLIIESAAVYHSGNYTCIATNRIGEINRTAILVVQGKWSRSVLPHTVYVCVCVCVCISMCMCQ